METKHEGFTPGPWRIDVRCSTHVISDARPICSAGGYQNNRRDPLNLNHENEANAALIASAPDLLAEVERLRVVNAELVAACKEAYAFMINHYRNRVMGLVPTTSLKIISAALARAEEGKP